MNISRIELTLQFETGRSPIPALTCPDAPELAGARSLPSNHSYGYGFMAGVLPATPAGPCALRAHVQNRSGRFCQSSPAFSRIWPAPECRITSLAILWCGIPMQSAG
jgi:hypothetical protein